MKKKEKNGMIGSRPFSLNLSNFSTGNSIEEISPVIQQSFKISRTQVSDDTRLCIVGSRNIQRVLLVRYLLMSSVIEMFGKHEYF